MLFVLHSPVQKRECGESQKSMGVSGELYTLPLPSGATKLATWDIDLRGDRVSGNTSATTSAGKVVGDRFTGFNEVELFGRKLIIGSIFSWPSIVEDLEGSASSKDLYAHRRTCNHLINERVHIDSTCQRSIDSPTLFHCDRVLRSPLLTQGT